MARPRSEERRSDILAAAVRAIAAQGLSAPTALIAKEAGVSNGSLFSYFSTKADLLNQLYVELKTEMGAAVLDSFPSGADQHEQLRRLWNRWLLWATAHPDKRRALAHLGVSDDITAESQKAGHAALAGMAGLLDRCRSGGPMRDAPLSLIVAIINGVADATMDLAMRDPRHAQAHRETAFKAVWRMIA